MTWIDGSGRVEMVLMLQRIGCYTGLLGALLVALNNRHSGWAFPLFLASNICWIGFAHLASVQALSVQHVGFIVTSLIGMFCGRKQIRVLRPPAAQSKKHPDP